MDKNKRIASIFKILVQFEKIGEPDSEVTEDSYKNYLDRLNVWYVGYGNDEITYGLEGLRRLGSKADHSTVRRAVFHIIDILNKEV